MARKLPPQGGPYVMPSYSPRSVERLGSKALYRRPTRGCHSHFGTFLEFARPSVVAQQENLADIVLSLPPILTPSLSEPTRTTSEQANPRRVQAVLALRLLEVLRDQDLPGEILEDEDPTQTMPRRFGLSDVVERQIRTYREDAKKGVRLTDGEVGDLFRFVIRRPDGEVVFRQVGRLLAADGRPKRWTRLLPLRARFAVARFRAKRTLRRVFGRQMGGFGRGPFSIEGRSMFFVESDPGGDACHLVSGFCQEILEYTAGGKATVTHTLCQARGDALCRWECTLEPTVMGPEPVPDADEREDPLS